MGRGTTLLIVGALGLAAGAGYYLGRSGDVDAPRPMRTGDGGPVRTDPDASLDISIPDPAGGETETAPRTEAPTVVVRIGETEPGELIAALKRTAGQPASQKILAAFVTQAAIRGPDMLPEIMDLLKSGEDLKLTGYKFAAGGLPNGYPSLRMALLDAAAATGDPASAELLREVAQSTQNPVEIVFSAHLLQKMDTLDRETARKALDSFTAPMTAEEARAFGSVASRFAPAAARIDPDYAEDLFVRKLRDKDTTPAQLRLLSPTLYGLDAERAGRLALSVLPDDSVPLGSKRLVAGRVAGRADPVTLQEMRRAIEARQVDPRVANTIARSSVATGTYGRIERNVRRVLRTGDLAAARGLANNYERRLREARLTIQAARAAGAKVSPEVNKLADIRSIRLADLRRRIAREQRRQERAAKKGS